MSEEGDNLLGEAVQRLLPPFALLALPQVTGLGSVGRRIRLYMEAAGWRVESAATTTVPSEWLAAILKAMVDDDDKPPTTDADKAAAYDRLCERINRRNRGTIL